MSDRVEDVVVWGNRRPPGSTGAYGGGANGGGKQDPVPDPTITEERVDSNPEAQVYYPCNTPEKELERAVDTGAADLMKAIKIYANDTHPAENGINTREYGAALWRMPGGAIAAGPITFSIPFGGDERPAVSINWTPPVPGAELIGILHTHSMGLWLPSGETTALHDQANLSYIIDNRIYHGHDRPDGPSRARIYVAASDYYSQTTPGPTKIHVYNKYNRDAAIGGFLGPEVDPDGAACPPA